MSKRLKIVPVVDYTEVDRIVLAKLERARLVRRFWLPALALCVLFWIVTFKALWGEL